MAWAARDVVPLADITLSSLTVIRPYKSRAGSPRIITPDASTAVSTALIKVGQVVQFDTGTSSAAHRVIRCSTAGGHPNLSTEFAGIAAASDTSDGSTTGQGEGKRQISVWAADANTEFLFPTKIAGVASTLVGTALALGFDSTLAIHYLAANSTAGDRRVWVTEVPNPGDTNGYVAGYFTSTAINPTVGRR